MKDALFDVEGRVIAITGGSGILGSSMARMLASRGASVVILDLNMEKAEYLVDSINGNGGNAIAIHANVTDPDSVEKAVDIVLNQYGKVDVLINAAGGNKPGATISPDKTIFSLNFADFQQVFDLNFYGTVLPSLAFGKAMADAKKGSIINISSMTVQQAVTRVVGYSAAKASVDNFTRWLAVEMALKFSPDIRVNAIAPGFFITEQNRTLLTNPDGSYTERAQDVLRKTPMNRFGEPEELHGALVWLCSPASNFVSGTVIPIDGGFSSFSGV